MASVILCAALVARADFSLQPGDILAANFGGNSVLKIDGVTGQVQRLGDFTTPTDVAITTNGYLYISEWDGHLYRLNLTNGVRELINPDTLMYAVWGLLVDPATGDLIVSSGGYDLTYDVIVRVNPTNGQESVISETNNLFGVSGMAWVDPATVVVCSTFNNQLVKVSLTDGAQTVVPTVGAGIDMPRGVAVYGGNIFMTVFDSREVRRVPVAGGEVTTYYTAAGFPFGTAVETNGNIVTGTSGAGFAVLRVSPAGVLLRSFTDPLISEVSGVAISPISLVATGLSNHSPMIDPIMNRTINEHSLISLAAYATDTDWPPQTLTFSLDPGAPGGATISSSGLFSWKPTESQGPSNYVITVRVTDNGSPAMSATTDFTLTVNEVNTRPQIHQITNRTVLAETLLTFTASATDTDLPPQTLTFTLEPGFPAGASITPQGVFAWTPPQVAAPVNYPIGVRVTDDAAAPLSATTNFTVQVLPGNQPPVPVSQTIERHPPAGAKLPIASVLGTDPDGDPVSLYSAGPVSANGGAVATNSAWIFYTPPAGFTNHDSFAFQVSDGRGGLGQGTVQVSVIDDPRPSQNLILIEEGSGTVRLRFSGIPLQPYTVQFTTNLVQGPWQILASTQADIFGQFTLTDTPPAGSLPRFYRSVVP